MRSPPPPRPSWVRRPHLCAGGADVQKPGIPDMPDHVDVQDPVPSLSNNPRGHCPPLRPSKRIPCFGDFCPLSTAPRLPSLTPRYCCAPQPRDHSSTRSRSVAGPATPTVGPTGPAVLAETTLSPLSGLPLRICGPGGGPLTVSAPGCPSFHHLTSRIQHRWPAPGPLVPPWGPRTGHRRPARGPVVACDRPRISGSSTGFNHAHHGVRVVGSVGRRGTEGPHGLRIR